MRRLRPTLCAHDWETLHSPQWTLSPCEKGRPGPQGTALYPDSCRPCPVPLLNVQVSGAGGPDPLPPTLGLWNLGEHTAPMARPASVHCLVLLSSTPQSQNLPAAHREPSDAGTRETRPRQRAWGWDHGGRRGGQLQSPRNRGKLLALALRGRSLWQVTSDSRGQTADSRGPETRTCGAKGVQTR